MNETEFETQLAKLEEVAAALNAAWREKHPDRPASVVPYKVRDLRTLAKELSDECRPHYVTK